MICAIVLLYFVLKSRTAVKAEAYVYSIITWTLFMFGITEILSAFYALTTGSLWLVWGTLDVVLLIICLKKKLLSPKLMRMDKAYKSIAYIAIFLAGVFFLAVKTIPYNWDSMTYHLGRIVHWYQNQSVAHYATNISRQVANPVLGAFVNLNVYTMLRCSDRLINLLQYFSYVTNGWLVYHIARKLRCSYKYAVLSCILFYSAPIAFAEALTTQVDNFSALYALCYVYLLLDFMHIEEQLSWNKESAVKVIMLGLCIAFGYLAKPSVGVAMLVYALWLLVISVLRRDSFLVILKLIITTIPGMIAVLAPEFLRNLQTFRAISAPSAGTSQLIGSLHEKYLIVNFLKNFTFNMPTIWIYDSSFLIWKYVMRFARWLEIDIDNPAISQGGVEFSVPNVRAYHHDTATNPVIVWLLIMSAIMLLVMIRRLRIRQLKTIKAGYYLASVFSFILFCTILKWEHFGSRYMITYLALLCPAIVVVIEWFMKNLWKGAKAEYGLLCIIGFCLSVEIIGMVCYHGRVAFGNYEERAEGYFVSRNIAYEPYLSIADYIEQNGFLEIGLIINEVQYEYPLWKMIEHYDRIEHVNVSNDTGIYEDWEYIPEVLIVLEGLGDDGSIVCHGYEYKLSWKAPADENVQVYVRVQP